MTETHTVRQDALPEDMRILLRDYPRDAWPDHPNFAASIQHWMGAHEMFRKLGKAVRLNTEGYLDKETDTDVYAARLSHYGNLLVRNLHGHTDGKIINSFQNSRPLMSDLIQALKPWKPITSPLMGC